ncbi:type IV secretion system DNA-binding domain-containing protein [Acrocarpospora sp. B8E8]|uniref:type IV secretion system DNA-binding domain-containing protein n=1 Tax=Acrocarpospora sp. B8E8 TaxID=3153572 RepID=UPI00325E73C9
MPTMLWGRAKTLGLLSSRARPAVMPLAALSASHGGVAPSSRPHGFRDALNATPVRGPGDGFGLTGPFKDPDALYGAVLSWLAADGIHFAIHTLLVVVALAVLVRVGQGQLRRWRHTRFLAGARRVQILAPPQVEPGSAEALWSNLIGLLRPARTRLLTGQPHLAWEYTWTGGRLEISLWVPGGIPQHLVEKAIEAAWPAARTRLTDPGPPIPLEAHTAGGTLVLARPDHYPLRSAFDADPLRPLLGAASGLAPGQYAVVQVLARPVTGARLGRARKAAAALRGSGSAARFGWLFDLITPGPITASAPRTQAAAHPEVAADVRAILGKAAHPRYATRIRYAVATSWDGDREAAQSWLRGRAHAIASALAGYAGLNHLRRRRLPRPAEQIASHRLDHGDLLSVPELAALAHLPYDPAVPGLARAGARSIAPGPDVPRPGPWCKPLGVADAGPDREIGLPVASARHHVQVIGATGVGKSTLLANMILADAEAGRAVVVIDPKGDLILDLLARLPETCAGRLVLLDPDDHAGPPALNVLGGSDPDLATDNLVGIFSRIFADFWGPRTEDIFRSACLTLRLLNDATLADVPRLLAEDGFRAAATAQVREQVLAGFWAWYAALSPPARAQVIGPLMNKLRAVLLRPFVRAVVGVPGPGLDMGAVLAGGGICLVRVPKGVLGEDTCRLLGSMVVAKVWEAASARARVGGAGRRDAALYIDEAHNFLTLPHELADMLAEARAYRLSLVLAHQNLAQLPREMREAVSANARTKVLFTLSPEDARALARHVQPNLTDHDLAHLGAYQAAARMLVGAADTPAFTLRTRPLPAPVAGREALLRRAARRTTASAVPAPGSEQSVVADPRTSPQAAPPPRLKPNPAPDPGGDTTTGAARDTTSGPTPPGGRS